MRPHGNHAQVNAQDPVALSQCDRCGRWWNRTKLNWQLAWAGTHLYNIQVLVCPLCYDTPNEQLRTIILPPDPPPVINARVPDFAYEEQTDRIIQIAAPPYGGTVPYVGDVFIVDENGNYITDENGNYIVIQETLMRPTSSYADQNPWGAGPQQARCTQFAGQEDSGQTRVLQYLTSIGE